MERDRGFTPSKINTERYASISSLDDEFVSSTPPAIQSGRSKRHAKSTRGNHRSGLRGKGREAFSRNNWMKNVI